MSTNHEFNQSALSWVKNELDESLREASLALEAFSESTDDITQLRFCLNHLYQVEGVLQMVELSGANLLAAETKALALSILEQKTELNGQALEMLMQGTLLLQDYLNRLEAGKKDHPLSVLPMVNELRLAHSKTPLKKIDFFELDLKTPLPETLTAHLKSDSRELPLVAAKIRPQYESALLSWFRNPMGDGLFRLAKIITELRQCSHDITVFRLWWLSQGVIEALQEGGLQATQEIKLLLGALNKQIKTLAQEGEPALAASITEDLLKSLLFQIANASSSGEEVIAIKETYQLENCLPSDRVLLTDLGTEIVDTVLNAFQEDLAQAKDLLDIFERTSEQPQQGLETLCNLFQKMADTLAILGFVSPIVILREAISQLEEKRQQGVGLDSTQHLELANTLLQIEASLKSEIASSRNSPTTSPANDTYSDIGESPSISAAGGDIQAAQNTATKECLNELAVVGQALTNYSKNPADSSVLNPISHQLQRTAGALSVLGLNRVAALIADCDRFINGTLIGKAYKTAPTSLEELAEAISAIELYLEMLTEGALASGSLLDTADDRLAHLLESLEQLPPDQQETAETANTPAVSEAKEFASENTEVPASTAINIDLIPSHPSHWEAPKAPVYPEGVDGEIATYFIEEAQEEMASIAENFSQWKQDLSQQEALKTVRRSFHTLKGSGRLAGATDLGELAWAIENMFNRIIDGTLAANPPVFETIEAAQRALPQLLTLFTQGGGTPPEEILALTQRAHTLADGAANPTLDQGPHEPEVVCAPSIETNTPSAEAKIPADDSKSTQEESQSQQVKQETATSTQHASALKSVSDPELLAAFLDEAEDILQTAETALADWRATPQERSPVQQLQRELHTLKGGARLANLTALGDLSHDLESLIITVIDEGFTGNEELFVLLQEGHDRLAEMCDAIRHGAALLAANDLSSRIRRVLDSSLPAEKASPTPDKPSQDDAPPSVPVAEATMVTVDPDNELVAAFLEEADELLQTSQTNLSDWQEAPSERAPVEGFQRELHTLKGGARLAGMTPLADLAHHMETVVSSIVEGKHDAEPALFELLQRGLDRLYTLRDLAQQASPLPSIAELLAEMSRYGSKSLASSQEDSPIGLAPSTNDQEPSATTLVPPSEQELHKTAQPLSENRNAAVEQVRVRADLLDHLVNNAAEVNIFCTRVEQQIGTMRLNLGEMEQTIARLRGQLRRLEIETEAQILYRHEEKESHHLEDFDPLEMDRYSQLHQLSRGLIESISDLTNIKETLDESAREADTLLLQQSRIGTDLQQGLMNTRMLPFTGVTPRLQRIVRQTAQELSKKVQLRIADGGLELDRTVLNRIVAPLEHMLRNSIAHGIEAPSARTKAGKEAMGTIHLSLIREGSEIVIQVRDDGQGIDLEKVRTKALAQGLVREESMPPDDELIQLILESGFSTADKVSQVAGRGVGMDVVNSEIRALNGTLNIASQKGSGTTFTVRLPLTLTIVQALLVETGNELFALPIISVHSVIRLDQKTAASLLSDEQGLYCHGGVNYRFIHLGAALGQEHPELPASSTYYPVLLVRSGEVQAAVLVDNLIGSREIVIKSMGPQLSTIKEITGATILGDGRVVLILDLPALIRKAIQKPETIVTIGRETDAQASQKSLVMVVDDSITIRKATQKLLERYGMEVLTARDGVDAVEYLQEHIPDIFLLDIEMPRMDGFELATFIRKDERLQDIPIIMITSRSGRKHRDRAEQIGVNSYLVKPYQEDELLQHIQLLLSPAEADVTV
ncbi:Hpt domain-containing protein [Nitrosococcus wardiae]|uniref:Chemotaxis protein CheA n=1 Tax=Nitrosococcus wardiae TaxID=1814290 RepID=A0A4P7BYW3_9GAMM|nr:Hpt domain-containing protein [Nitrosococcus wardiae]QBQ54370.1 response regulator [Nitrosococcus wardiae]